MITYEKLLSVFWKNIDPTTQNRQFCDPGTQYRPAIFYHDETQRQLAEQSKLATIQSKTFAAPIITSVVESSAFYVAEEYHQDYYKKNPVRYKFYKWNCGRAQRLAELWGEM